MRERSGFEKLDVYRLAEELADTIWRSVRNWKNFERDTIGKQIVRSADSIGANIAEGYGRGSGKDRVRFWEYALGSAREARGWYFQARHIISGEVALHRMRLLTQITRLLLSAIPDQRQRRLAEPPKDYQVVPADLLDDAPMP